MLKDQGDSIDAVAARLRRLREITGLSKNEFAARADMAEQTYGAFENGKRALSLEGAKKIRKAYGASLEFLFFGDTDALPHRIAKEL